MLLYFPVHAGANVHLGLLGGLGVLAVQFVVLI